MVIICMWSIRTAKLVCCMTYWYIILRKVLRMLKLSSLIRDVWRWRLTNSIYICIYTVVSSLRIWNRRTWTKGMCLTGVRHSAKSMQSLSSIRILIWWMPVSWVVSPTVRIWECCRRILIPWNCRMTVWDVVIIKKLWQELIRWQPACLKRIHWRLKRPI